MQNAIREASLAGQIVLLDRYSDSGIAYSVAKGMPIEKAYFLEKGLIRPDATIFMDTPPSVAGTRGDFGNQANDRIELQERVYEAYMQLLRPHKYICIDGEQDVDRGSWLITRRIEELITDTQRVLNDFVFY